MLAVPGRYDAKLSIFQAGECRICSHDVSKPIATMPDAMVEVLSGLRPLLSWNAIVKRKTEPELSINTVQNYSIEGQGDFCNRRRLNFEQINVCHENQLLAKKCKACPQACSQIMWVTWLE